jgi:hypothetical protein
MPALLPDRYMAPQEEVDSRSTIIYKKEKPFSNLKGFYFYVVRFCLFSKSRIAPEICTFRIFLKIEDVFTNHLFEYSIE